MNSKEDKNTQGDDTSSVDEESSSSVHADRDIGATRPASSVNPEMKRSAVKELIERYFYQLQRGCGNPQCSNANCASSGKVDPMSPNEIAARAIQLFSQDAKLCENYSSQTPKVPRTQTDTATSSKMSRNGNDLHSSGDTSSSSSSMRITRSVSANTSSGSNSSTSSGSGLTTRNGPMTRSMTAAVAAASSLNHQSVRPPIPSPVVIAPKPINSLPLITFVNESIMNKYIDEMLQTDCHEKLLHAINEVFWSTDRLGRSFYRAPLTAAIKCEMIDQSMHNLKKEDIRTMEGETDKDVDSSCQAGIPPQLDTDDVDIVVIDQDPVFEITTLRGSDTLVDFEGLRRIKSRLFAMNNAILCEALNSNVQLLCESIKYRKYSNWDIVLHCIVICVDIAANSSNNLADLEYLECSMPQLCHAINSLPVQMQARLARIWSVHCPNQLRSLIQCLQQLITLRAIIDEDKAQDNSDIRAVTVTLKVAFYANLLASKCESSSTVESQPIEVPVGDDNDLIMYVDENEWKSTLQKFSEDTLGKLLEISVLQCRQPLVAFDEFYNEALSDAIHMDRDYLAYRNLALDYAGADHFTYMMYSFILTPATKVIALYYDSRIRMYSERSSSLFNLMHLLGPDSEHAARPDLKLKVRRDNIINDALIGLEMVALSNPKDLKKQLVVEFVGEQGIDEGGVSKEFFQLVVDEIFNPDYGMFIHHEETKYVWFNSLSFENEGQFTLIGILLGLAIYNNVILPVNFPMVVYRKLMGIRGTYYDLKDWSPELYKGLTDLLEYNEGDMEDVFMQTFKISYKNVFGDVVSHELMPGGANVWVEQQNKQEFVDMYSDFLLNKSIHRQFKAFKNGFEMVTDESPLKLLFRPEEIELLVCGSRNFDFNALEKATDYDGGYQANTQIIRDFWSIVHAMPEDDQRKLLEFTTGSDRIPVGGLGNLKLVITRNGPDTDRLPTSHTCFNVLLLPEYSTKAKLEERLLKAINNSKGFGML